MLVDGQKNDHRTGVPARTVPLVLSAERTFGGKTAIALRNGGEGGILYRGLREAAKT
jgi:hypothetical protein